MTWLDNSELYYFFCKHYNNRYFSCTYLLSIIYYKNNFKWSKIFLLTFSKVVFLFFYIIGFSTSFIPLMYQYFVNQRAIKYKIMYEFDINSLHEPDITYLKIQNQNMTNDNFHYQNSHPTCYSEHWYLYKNLSKQTW